MSERHLPDREIPRFDGMPPGAHQRPQERPQTMAEQWDAQTHTNWKAAPRRAGRIMGLLFGYSLYGTLALTGLCALLILGAVVLGGGGNG